MRKIICFLVVVMILALFCACSGDVHDHDHDHAHEMQTTESVAADTATQPTANLSHRADATGPLSSKHSEKIDTPFDNEYAGADTDSEKINVCDKYREEWKKIADRYYNEILYYNGDVPVHSDFSTDAQMHEFVQFKKAEFDRQFESESQSYLTQMENQYGKGDKASAMCAEYKFELQRSFALEMIEIYELLGEFNGQVF